jgi:hypothetical protein
MTGAGGGGVDLSALNDIFASKIAPDNTIKRIEALENNTSNTDF